ncbi:MAG: hypothetical protein QXR09_03660 [Candidatus Aenigmatarchaeota archaeon]
MKSQSSLLVLVFLLGTFFILWLLSTFLTTTSSQRLVQETLISKISKYLDYVKGFTRNALIFAVHAETKYIAGQGGQTSDTGFPRSWICNTEISPKVDEVRFFLSEETKLSLNKYLNNFKLQDLPIINITNSTCVDYDVNENSVLSGKNDEKFNVGAYGSKTNITLDENLVTSSNEVYEEIAQNRFWYMYRKFREWAPVGTGILVGGTCNCLSRICACGNSNYVGGCQPCSSTCPGFQSCLENLVETARKALQNSFDEYVTCTAKLIGCYHELEPCSGIPQCIDWEDAPACRSCFIEKPGELCSKSILSERTQTQSFSYFLPNSNLFFPKSKNKIYFSDSCSTKKCKVWFETKGSMEAVFSCTDKKYLLSVLGDRYLIFSVHTMVKLRSMNCYDEGDCIESNGVCVCPPGNWCTGCE